MTPKSPNLIEKSKCEHKHIENNMIPDTCRDCGKILVEETNETQSPNYIESVLKKFNNLGYSQLFKDEKIFICPVCKNTEFICKKCIESFLSTALEKQREELMQEIPKAIEMSKQGWIEEGMEKQQKELEQIILKSRTVDEKYGVGLKEETARQQILVDLSLLKE